MTITTYVNDSDDHMLSPNLTEVDKNVTAVLKSGTDLLNPVLVLSNNLSHDFNYIYISEFKRYYFCKVFYSQNMYIAECHVDALYSWKAYIDELNVIANRSSSDYNTYQVDNTIPFLAKSRVTTVPFPSGFMGNSWMLSCNGGDFN